MGCISSDAMPTGSTAATGNPGLVDDALKIAKCIEDADDKASALDGLWSYPVSSFRLLLKEIDT